MIDLMTSGALAALTPPAPAERRDEGSPAFAVVLAQAAAGQDAPPVPPPEPTIALAQAARETLPLPEPVAVETRPVVVDHATRFDARGMIAMAAGVAHGDVTASIAAIPVATEAATAPLPPALPVEDRMLPVGGAARPAAVATLAPPGERAVPVRSTAAPVLSGVVPAGDVAPSPVPPEEPEVALAPAARPRTRFAAMAQGAPQVAVVALADGLAVSAAVGALSEGERHRLRDAIAATLSRHGLRPRAVTLLAMPAPFLSTER